MPLDILFVDREVYFDYGMMDELSKNVKEGFRKFCTALFAGGPKISDTQLAQNAKDLVVGVEQAGVLDKNADRLAVEKLARYFMRTFKDKQLGKETRSIKEAVGTDLQTLTENNVFRFPSTFTFIFRAFTSIDGIGKELNPDFDLGSLAQPFIQDFIDEQKGYSNKVEKNIDVFRKATGLNSDDLETALMQPRKVLYIEQTLRSMEEGNLKIRVRSLENEKALERQSLRQGILENAIFTAVVLNGVQLLEKALYRKIGLYGAAFFALKAAKAALDIKKFDKTQAKFKGDGFASTDDDDEEE